MVDQEVAGDLGQQGRIPRPAVPAPDVRSPDLPDICQGCGRHHGSVGQELGCLRRELEAARSALRSARLLLAVEGAKKQ